MLPTTKSFPPTKLPRIALMEEDFAASVARRLDGESRGHATHCTKKLPLHFIYKMRIPPLHFIYKMSLHTDFQMVNFIIFWGLLSRNLRPVTEVEKGPQECVICYLIIIFLF